jgi:hypothetical protein
MHLNDVSYWCINVGYDPCESAGLAVEKRRFHADRCTVEILDEVDVSVRESNHAMVVNV